VPSSAAIPRSRTAQGPRRLPRPASRAYGDGDALRKRPTPAAVGG
jgi:hypothetical protein